MNKFLVSLFAVFALLALPFQAFAVTSNITAIYGTGNPDADWDVFVSAAGSSQIGLRAKNSVTGATPDNGAGLYTYNPGDVWSIEASFNSNFNGNGGPLSGYTYSWTLAGPGIAGGSVTFSPTLYGDNSYGTAATLNGAGVEGTFAALGGTNDIMQLSQKISFAPFSGSYLTEGLYTLSASMNTITGQRSMNNAGSINIRVGAESVPDGGATVAMLGFGLVAMGLVHQRRTRQSDSPALMAA